MIVTRVELTGTDLLRVVDDLQQTLGDHYAFVQPTSVVLIGEHVSRITEGSVQTTLIVVLHGETACQIEIISGGGQVGVFMWESGEDQIHTQRLVQAIERSCQRYDWTMTLQP